LNWVDYLGFIGFTVGVVAISMYKSRRERNAEDYFLGGRGLGWTLVGLSLVASNISTEHFVGMSGAAFGGAGLAIASYEWIAAVSLVLIGLFLLPLYLKMGIYTMPEFLEYRYGKAPRALMAVFMMTAYVGVALAAVLYSGAIGLKAIFGWDLAIGIWVIGIVAGIYTTFGGLKAVAWADLFQGIALIVGGMVVTLIGLSLVGDLPGFFERTSGKFHMILPADHPDIPWTALLFGIWIPNFFYWGFNQFITQRALGAQSLSEGQRGVMFAASLKVFIPFIVVLPGIIAYELYADSLQAGDMAYPTLIKNVVPFGLRGMLLAALTGAIMSTLAALLNSVSTIFTIDLYKRFWHPEASQEKEVRVGRMATVAFTVIACLVAPLPGQFEGVFRYMQMVWGFISPGIVAVFVFGLVFRRAPTLAAMTALIAGGPIYGLLLWALPKVAFLNHMAITFTILIAAMGVITWLKPLKEPVVFVQKGNIDLKPSRGAKTAGYAVIAMVALLYVVFW
jgi:SSS family solute:Na+ symporter